MPNPWSDTGLNEFTYYVYPYIGDVYRVAYEVWTGIKT